MRKQMLEFFIHFIVLINICRCAESPRAFVLRRDVFNGFKANEYSVYDENENDLLYRVESRLALRKKIDLVSYPSRKVIGRLDARTNTLRYKADLAVLDTKKNQWISGDIDHKLQSKSQSFTIHSNGKRISMNKDNSSSKFTFQDNHQEILAQYQRRPSSYFLPQKYDLTIYSDSLPDQFFVLALVASEQMI